MSRIIKSNFVNPVSLDKYEYIEQGHMEISENGIITSLLQEPPEDLPSSGIERLENKVILPGFIDTHLHLPQYQFLGKGLGIELLPWLTKFTFPAEERFLDPDFAEAVAREFFCELLKHGTTTACVYSTIHETATDRAFQVAYDMGYRAFIGKVMMDRNSPPNLTENTIESIDQSMRLASRWDGKANGRLRYIFSPRFAPTCSDELMSQVGKIAGDGAYVQTHLSENKGEIQWMSEMYPGLSYTSVYEKFGIFGEHVIMGHCIHLNEYEINLISESKTKVAHCPYSNENLKSGVMPYYRLKENGIDISIGTDIAGGPSLSMPVQMRKAIDATIKISHDCRVMSPVEAFYLSTIGGAKALGIDNITGDLQVGKDADFLVIGPKSIGFDLQKGLGNGFLEKLVNVSGNSFVDQVYIRGKKVYSR